MADYEISYVDKENDNSSFCDTTSSLNTNENGEEDDTDTIIFDKKGDDDIMSEMFSSSYLFEPTISEFQDESEQEEEDEQDEDDESSKNQTQAQADIDDEYRPLPQDRMADNWWCMCGKWCRPQTAKEECICCTELESTKKILDLLNLGKFNIQLNRSFFK